MQPFNETKENVPRREINSMSRLRQSVEPERVLAVAFVVVVATTWKCITFGGNVIAEYSGFLVRGAWFRDTISMQIPTDSILIPKCPVQGLLLLESLLFHRWQEIFIRVSFECWKQIVGFLFRSNIRFISIHKEIHRNLFKCDDLKMFSLIDRR